jgi:hypothetical protein
MMSFVLIQDGVVVQKQQSPDEGFIEAPDDVVCGYFCTDGEFTAPELVPSIPPPPHINNGGLARFTGAAPVSVLEAIKMAGVTRISKGRYRVTHEEAMPSDQYSVGLAVMDALPRTIRYTARTANYVEVRVTDLAGAVQDPAEITVSTQRVVTPS